MHAPVRGFEGEVAVFDAVQLEGHGQVQVDRSRDALLTDFGKATLDDRYLLPGESYQDLFARVASAFGDDAAHSQRLYDYISRLWFMPATPLLSNGGAHARAPPPPPPPPPPAPLSPPGPARAGQWRHPPRPADLLLPERGLRQPGRHR